MNGRRARLLVGEGAGGRAGYGVCVPSDAAGELIPASHARGATLPGSASLIAPVGQLTTIGRNLQVGAASLCGVVCLLALALNVAPWPNAIIPGVSGVLLLIAALIAAFRGVPVVRRASVAARLRTAAARFTFLQMEFLDESGTAADSAKWGFVLVWDDRMEIDFRRASSGIGAPHEQRIISFVEIRDVRLREPTSMTYAMPVVELNAGEAIAFTIMPKSGSVLRGPSESETREVVELLRARSNRDAR